MRALGLMSGTSLDAVDLAVIETDGIEVFALGPAGEYRLPDGLRQQCMAATQAARDWTAGPEPDLLKSTGLAIAEFQAEAALAFLRSGGLTRADLDIAGFHGQTLLHVPPASGRPGRSLQIGDPHVLARRLGVPVVYDLRQADLAAGGQGAPLAPIYHAALVRRSGFTGPTAVLNLGGVANLTFMDGDDPLVAFDAGPANGPLDQWVERHGRGRYDEGGRISGSGKVDEDRIASWLSDPFFSRFGPKSLDRFAFGIERVEGTALEDGAATLAAFSAACVGRALAQAPRPSDRLIVCGGGRHNATLMAELGKRAPAVVLKAEEVGWRGDTIEAEAWAYLAARSVKGLPITFPGTTGVQEPLTGGRMTATAPAPDATPAASSPAPSSRQSYTRT